MKYLATIFLAIFLSRSTVANLTSDQEEEIEGTIVEYANRAFEGFAVEDFVPNTYLCVYSGVSLVREGNYTH